MGDEENMPSAEERTIELCQYSNRVFGTADVEFLKQFRRRPEV
jgi:hypothetical protein